MFRATGKDRFLLSGFRMISRSVLSRLGINFLALTLVRGFSVIAPLILMPFLVKTVGIGNWGRINFALAATAFAGPIVMYGFSVSATANIARLRDRDPELKHFWQRHIATSLWLALWVVGAGSVAILVIEHDREMRVLFLGALLLSVATALVPVWLFMGMERMRSLVFSNAVNRLGYIALVLLLVRDPADSPKVTAIAAAAATAGLALALLDARRAFKLSPTLQISAALLRRTLSDGFPAFLLLIVPMAYNAGGIVLLGVSADAKSVGLFTIATTVVEVAITSGRLFAGAALPLIATEVAHHRLFARVSLLVGVSLGIAIATASPWLAGWLAPNDAEQVTVLLWLLAASIPFGFAQLAYNQNCLALFGAEKLASQIVTVISVLGCLVAILLVPRFGATGAATAILASRAALGISSYLAFRKLDVSDFQQTRLEVGA